MPTALILLAALVANMVGMSWLALTMDTHWRQVHDNVPRKYQTARRLRIAGALALLTSLGLCLAVDHASMASLVWVMALTAAALVVAFTLTWRPHWLRVLVPGLRRQDARKTQTLVTPSGP